MNIKIIQVSITYKVNNTNDFRKDYKHMVIYTNPLLLEFETYKRDKELFNTIITREVTITPENTNYTRCAFDGYEVIVLIDNDYDFFADSGHELEVVINEFVKHLGIEISSIGSITDDCYMVKDKDGLGFYDQCRFTI